jgi:hypothetical protein
VLAVLAPAPLGLRVRDGEVEVEGAHCTSVVRGVSARMTLGSKCGGDRNVLLDVAGVCAQGRTGARTGGEEARLLLPRVPGEPPRSARLARWADKLTLGRRGRTLPAKDIGIAVSMLMLRPDDAMEALRGIGILEERVCRVVISVSLRFVDLIRA